jgi:ribosomal protein S18 acetylase RimI-like enzyme
MNPQIVLKKLEVADLVQVARVHISSFPDSALTKLGVEIVRRYYLWQLNPAHEKVWAVGAFAENECVGFSFGGVFNHSVSGFVYRNKTHLAKEVLLHPKFLSNPFFLKRIHLGIKMIRHFAKKQKALPENKPKTTKNTSFGILAIGVAPDFQKHGIGKLLILDAEKEAISCGFEQMDLSVHPTNTKAIRFYEKLDWQKVPPNDSWTGVMIKKLTRTAAQQTISSPEQIRQI